MSLNEKILQVVGKLLAEPAIDADIYLEKYHRICDIKLKPKNDFFSTKFLKAVLTALPDGNVIVTSDESLGLHITIQIDDYDDEAD